MKAHFLTTSLIITLLIASSLALTLDNFRLSFLGKAKPHDFNITSQVSEDPQIVGAKCLLCTALLMTIERYAELHSLSIDTFIMDDFCKMLPVPVQVACKEIVNTYGPAIIQSLVNDSSPDKACREAKVCLSPQCTLFPKTMLPKVTLSPEWNLYQPSSQPHEIPTSLLRGLGLIASEGGDTPLEDLDKDLYSSLDPESRGYNWRGRDCNDLEAGIHPGRKTDPLPGAGFDYDCNGISGVDPSTKKAWKDELCANSGQLGVVVMGDSAGAHAIIPAQWANASAWDKQVFENLLPVILNEVDYPQFSAYTGYEDSSPFGPVRSVYKYLFERNQCNFRDYQNLGVNGADSFTTLNNTKELARDQVKDYPLLVILELLGNDVCGNLNTFDTMTTPQEFRQNVIEILDYLDTRFPPGSHLLLLSLVNGSLIYDSTKNATHPLGVSYSDFYDYLNCLEASFCWGWMNSNATIRELTTQRAMELNAVYEDIVSTYKAKNYDILYYPFPANQIWDQWVQAGGNPFDLITPMDGFHPSQITNALIADTLWNHIMQVHPEWLGAVNPNNAKITQLFGNQGGY